MLRNAPERTALVALLISALLTTLTFSCSRGNRLSFYADKYFQTAFLEHGGSEDLKAAVTGLGLAFTIRSEAIDGAESFIELLAKDSSEFVVMSPFYADLASAAAPVYRERRFIVLYGDRMQPQQNIQRLGTDRTTSYNQAGKFAAAVLNALSGQTEQPARLLILAYTGNETRNRELETFLEGFTTTDGGTTPVPSDPEIHRFASLQDERAAIRIVSAGAGEFDLAFVSMASMTAAILAALSGTEGLYIITEGPIALIPAPDMVIATIEEDWISAISASIDSRNPRILIPSAVLAGPGLGRLPTIDDGYFGYAD